MGVINFRYDALDDTLTTASTEARSPRDVSGERGVNEVINETGVFQTIVLPIVAGLMMVIVGFLASVLVIMRNFVDLENDANRPTSSTDLWLLAGAVTLGLITGVAAFLLTRKIALNTKQKNAANLAMIRWFAADNNLLISADPLVDKDTQPGLLFRHGLYHHLAISLQSQRGPDFQLANGSCLIKTVGKKPLDYRYAFIRLKLPRQVPHIVLDSPRNNMLSAIGWLASADYGPARQLRLEGNFNEYFRLYVPQGYERDALYIFTPDIMQLMMEIVNDYDIELVGDSLYIWRPGAFTFTDKTEMQALEQIINRLLPKIEHQTDYYNDDRTGSEREANIVAPAGQRITPRS